ncbi:MAG: LacI family DNA-binding transcriptional regulator [Eubacteriales bacterium]|nr:LacI family DNA-binding transcriptional regulator [Eubacteriales bacterium]
MVTMKDIARECEVSIATVSKALSGRTDIGEDTRSRILKTAEALGYMTNSAARALKTNRTYNIGVLFVDEQESGLTHEYFSAVLDSLKCEAEKHGYDITFINRNVGEHGTTYLQHSRYRGVDGVVIACVNFNDPQVVELVESGLPVVTIDHVFNNRLAVLSDNTDGMMTLVNYICSMGHRKIAYIYGDDTTVTRNRMTGFYRACEANGLEIPEEYVIPGRYHESKLCYKATQQLLQMKERPTCIIFPDDFSYIGGMNAIHEAGLRIPEDISAVGYDGIGLSRIVSPPLTTYVQDTKVLGETAASKLIELIEHSKTVIMDRVIVSGRLQEGRTVKKLEA